jgi:peptidoglycan/LPS O-acetylase OafA/YrhL
MERGWHTRLAMGRVGERSAFAALTGPGGLTYQPGLDGLRGLAVAAVVAFHLGSGWATGGYLGVSLFFTLSGVLIGTLILNEIVTTGRFALWRFWQRRARRLLPPALVTLAIVAVGRLLTTSLAATSRGDVVAAGLNVANWHYLAKGSSYAELFGGPSALLHFWSLAIEEQFYLVVGAFAVLLAARANRPVRLVFVVAMVTAACSFLTPVVTGASVDRVYFGSDTRAGELMVGVAAAAVFVSAKRRRIVVSAGVVLAVIAAAALAATVALWLLATPGTDALRNGLLPLTAGCSLLVIVGALLPVGPVAAFTSAAPLRWLGRISYAVYLIHWPVIVVANRLTDDRSLVRSTILVAISLVLAQLSAAVIEVPVRRHRVSGPHLGLAAAVVLLTVGVAAGFTGRTPRSAALLDDLSDRVEPSGPAAASGPAAGSGVPRIALYGDSVGFSMLLALGHAEVEPAFERAPSDVSLGCGIAVSPAPPLDQPHRCDNPAERFFLKAVAGKTDVAIMMSCQWEVMRQSFPGDPGGPQVVIGDPDFDRYVREQYTLVADRLTDAGVDRILWLTCPYISQVVGVDGLSERFRDSRDPTRVDRLNTIITELAADHETVEVLAFRDWVNERVDDASIRPDGSHYEYRRHNEAADVFIEMINAALPSPG